MQAFNRAYTKALTFLFLDKKTVEKAGIDFNRPFGKYLNQTNNFTVIAVLVIAFLQAIDFSFFSGQHFYRLFLPALELIFEHVPLDMAPMQLFYYVGTVTALVIALFFTIVAYINSCSNICWLDMTGFTKIKNSILGRLWVFITAILGIIIFFVGGYLISIVAVEATFLKSIPAIEILQAFIASKALGFVAVSMYQMFSSLVPHKIHWKS